MNLETKLEPRLWEAVRMSIEGRKFTGAIVDSIFLLSEVIRERAGLDGDGLQLVGAAFGGTSPKLKVNRLQTESERNVQRGVEALLRGLYQAIRNPRSHGAYQDEERDAIAILLFVDYLLRIVDRSRSPFSLSTFVEKVLDSGFVPKDRYATLLVSEIPTNRHLAVCREVFARRSEADPVKTAFFFAAIFQLMPKEEIAELNEVVSEELRQTDEEDTVRFVLKALPPDNWPHLDELARLRIENRLITSVADGSWDKRRGLCTGGALGTWATNIIGYFTLREDLWRTLGRKLRSHDSGQQDYVFRFFLDYAETCLESPPASLVGAMNAGLRAGDIRFKEVVEAWALDPFGDNPPESPWRKPFADALAKFVPAAEGQEITDDDIPF